MNAVTQNNVSNGIIQPNRGFRTLYKNELIHTRAKVDGESVEIYESQNYDMFRFDDANRDLVPTRLANLERAIQNHNMLHLFPITVTEGLVIMDGQHRYTVAKKLGIPIYYVISKKMTIRDAAQVSQTSARWTTMDYMSHWCKMGNQSYIDFKEFMERHPWLHTNNAMKMCTYGNIEKGESITSIFAKGEYLADDIPFAENVCKMVQDFARWVSFSSDARFIQTISMLAANANYNHAHMMMKMEWQSTKLVKCGDTQSYMKVINDIYNFKVTEAKRVTLRRLGSADANYRQDRKQQKQQGNG